MWVLGKEIWSESKRILCVANFSIAYTRIMKVAFTWIPLHHTDTEDWNPLYDHPAACSAINLAKASPFSEVIWILNIKHLPGLPNIRRIVALKCTYMCKEQRITKERKRNGTYQWQQRCEFVQVPSRFAKHTTKGAEGRKKYIHTYIYIYIHTHTH